MRIFLLFIFPFFCNITITYSQCNLNWSIKNVYDINYVDFTKIYTDLDNNIYHFISFNKISGGIHPKYSVLNKLTKYDSKGNLIWKYDNSFSGDGGYTILNAISDSFGNIFICQSFNNGAFTSINTTHSIIEITNKGKDKLIYESPLEISENKKIYLDQGGNFLMLTLGYKYYKLMKISSLGAIEWETLDSINAYDLVIGNNNHIHILVDDGVFDLNEDGTLANTILMPSINILNASKKGRIRILETGDSLNYFVFVRDWDNYYSIIKTSQTGKVLFQKNGNSNSSTNKYSDNNLILSILPSNNLIFGPTVDSIPYEDAPASLSSLSIHILNSDGTDKSQINLYSTNSAKYIINENFIFSYGYGKKDALQLDIHNFNGVRICDPIEFNNDFYEGDILATNGIEFYFASNSENPKYTLLNKYNEGKTNVNEFGENPILLYPNPGDKFIKIKGIEALKVYSYTIINSIGLILKSGKISYDDMINIEEFNSGVYFIKLENAGETNFLKLIITK